MRRFVVTSENTDAALQAAVECLERGELLLFPTETTYGLAADATNPAAIQRLMEYKTQRGNKPLSILVTDQAMAEQYVELNATAQQAYSAFLPGPVTVVSVGKHTVAPGVESSNGSLGVRISSHPLAQKLVERFGKPITATSANASGEKRPYRIDDVLENTSQRQQALLSMALDVGTLPPNPPSTVIDTSLETIQVIRQGELAATTTETATFPHESATKEWGEKLAKRFRSSYGYRPVVFALTGPMGAGKTHLAQGLAVGLGVSEPVTSPSYTLLHEYVFKNEGKDIPLWHIDAWRLEDVAELDQLELPRLFSQNGVLILEWANLPQAKIDAWKDVQVIGVDLAYGVEENERLATFHLYE